MSRISSIKPEDDETRKRPMPQITWNNKTEQSLKEQGFWPEPNKDGYYEEPPKIDVQEKNFLSEVDIRQGPIQREVTKIVRLKAIDWSSEKKGEKGIPNLL